MNAIPADDAVPRIPPRFRLQFEAAQDRWVLLYPEGMVQLNLPAAEILKRCDGEHTVAAVIEELQTAFGQADLRADVTQFLTDAYARGWLV